MSVDISCPQCGASFAVGEDRAGEKAACPQCNAQVDVPAAAAKDEGVPTLDLATAAAGITADKPKTEGDAPMGVVKEDNITAGTPPPVPELAGAPRRPSSARCPECGIPITEQDERCPECGAFLEEEVARGGSEYVSCPKCRTPDPNKVAFTWWGSVYGPAMFSHVRCVNCGYGYNGRTGGSNFVPALIFVLLPALFILAICGGMGWYLWTLFTQDFTRVR